MNLKQIFVIAIIAMFLIVPFASAKQEAVDVVKDTKQDKKIDEKAVDKTKEQPKEVKNKDKDITGKITVTDSDTSAYTVTKEGDAAIKIKRSGEHTKAKVAIPKEELQKIDEDGDKLYGVLHIADDGTTTHDIVTESELIAGTDMTFSENIVNGYTGYYEKTQTGVTSGTVIDIPDVSGSDYYISASVSGTIPTYAAVTPTVASTYPQSSNLCDAWLWQNSNVGIRGSTAYGTVSYYTLGNDTGAYASSGNMLVPYSQKLATPTGNFSTYFNFVPRSKLNTSMPSTLSISRYAANNTGFMTTIDGVITSYNYNGVSPSGISTTKSSWDAGRKYSYAYTSSTSGRKVYIDGVNTNNATAYGYVNYAGGYLNLFNGNSSCPAYMFTALYNTTLTDRSIKTLYARGDGISFQPEPSYNFTSYNVASGVEKIIDTDATCTGLEYVDTTGGTHTVTVRVYFTEDITKTVETKGAVYQNVSIIHTKQNATASVGTIAYELDPLYSGTPVLSSNNTNATISRNDTHVLISTGLIKQGQSFSYAVSVPDNHDHIIFKNRLMQWMGSGWDYVGVAPDDWADAITDIEVTVS